MTSWTGFVTYTDFVAGDDKGGVQHDDLFNGAYGLGKMNEARASYTSAYVVEEVEAKDGETKIAWIPATKAEVVDDGTELFVDSETGILYTDEEHTEKYAPAEKTKIKYIYDNVVIPQKKLVHLRAIQRAIPLKARCRRIAITYSLIAQFQAKTDYNMDLNQQLVAQASGELAYEIDSEGIDLLCKAAVEDARLTFSRTQPIGVSLRDHFEAFSRILAVAKAIVYNRTQKYQPNYMVCAADCLDVLSMNSQFRPAATGAVYGPYFAGTFGSLKVYVSPMLEPGKFFIGVNGSDLQTSAAVYAPYMPVVPTQLLGLPDGTMTQGFATMYDLRLLSRAVAIDGDKVEVDYDNDGLTIGEFSPLLVAGKIVD